MKTILFAAAALAALPCFAQEDDKQLKRKEVRELQKIVEGIRELTYKKNVKVSVMDEAGLRKEVRKEFDEEWPVEKAVKVEHSYKKLGLIPEDMDLREFMVDLMSENIGGYYDPRTKQLFLITRKDKAGDAMNEAMKNQFGVDWDTMATIHELTHALQDQYFDLQTIPTDREDNDDLVEAMKCVFEGEANFVMYQHVLSKRGMNLRTTPDIRFMLMGGGSGTPSMEKAPMVLKRGLMFPYMEGMVFVHDVLRKGEKWETVESLYADLPLSTEQVMHPEKFFDHDYPQEITLPEVGAAMGKGWAKIDENTLGELNIGVLLGEFLDRKRKPKTIAKAAAGWDGDRYAVYEKGDDRMLAFVTTWDSEDDATEFFAAAEKALVKKLGADAEPDGDDRRMWDGGSLLERRGSDVLWLETAGAASPSVRKQIWKGLKKAELKKVDRKPPKEKTDETPSEETRENNLVDNDVFVIKGTLKGMNWRLIEDGDDAEFTWKAKSAAIRFHSESKKGRTAEEALEDAVEGAKKEATKSKRTEWSANESDAPSAGLTGTSEELGEFTMGILVLEAGKKFVIVRVAGSGKDFGDAEKALGTLLKGFRAK